MDNQMDNQIEDNIYIKQVRLPKKRKQEPVTYERDPKPRDTDKRKPKNLREWQQWSKNDE
jgi:hypothetical protein